MFILSNKCSNVPSLLISRAISCTPLCFISNHYMVLGLTPAATQEEIKTAYFELCKKYHPDKNKGSQDGAKMFRSITEAYEVLGNEKSRKLYDNSMFYGGASRPTKRDVNQYADYNYEEEKTFYQKRNSYKTYTGRTWYYDFDAWKNAHYPNIKHEEQLRAEKERRRKWKKEPYEYEFDPSRRKKHFPLYVGLIIALGCALSVLPIMPWADFSHKTMRLNDNKGSTDDEPECKKSQS